MADIELLRRIGKQCFVLIYLIYKSRPVSVQELAADLGIHHETALAYLRKLADEQVATRTRIGWMPTVAGMQLVLPADAAAEIPREVAEKPREDAEIPRLLINNKEVKEIKNQEDKGLLINAAENPREEALKSAGIKKNGRTVGIFEAEHLMPEHIEAAREWLEKQYRGRYTTGLLISTLETIRAGDRPYMHRRGCACAACALIDGSNYASWEDLGGPG